jgi:hypothetical protein
MNRDHLTDTALDIVEQCDFLAEILIEKNRQYGDSALNPVRLFSAADPVEQLKVRIDDKLSRIRTAADDDLEDPLLDLTGYLVLLLIARRRQVARAARQASPPPLAAIESDDDPAVYNPDDWQPIPDPDPPSPSNGHPVQDLAHLCGRPRPVRVATT